MRHVGERANFEGTEVTLERDLGAGDFLVRKPDGSREAVSASRLADIPLPAEAPQDLRTAGAHGGMRTDAAGLHGEAGGPRAESPPHRPFDAPGTSFDAPGTSMGPTANRAFVPGQPGTTPAPTVSEAGRRAWLVEKRPMGNSNTPTYWVGGTGKELKFTEGANAATGFRTEAEAKHQIETLNQGRMADGPDKPYDLYTSEHAMAAPAHHGAPKAPAAPAAPVHPVHAGGPIPTGKAETAWLVEQLGSPPTYLSRKSPVAFNTDSMKAMRFQTKAAAQHEIDAINKGRFPGGPDKPYDLEAREHAWHPAP